MGPRRRLISMVLTAAAAAGAAAARWERPVFARGALQDAAQPTAQPTVPANAQATGQPPTTAPSARAGADVAGDLERLAETFRNAGARPGDRDDAAARLVSRQSDHADEILLEVLETGSAASRLSIARALADDPSPRGEFIGPLSALLSGGEQRSAALAEAAANALATYRRNPAALGHLIRAAGGEAEQPPALRVAAIRATGRVVDPAAAEALVQLVNAPAGERREVRDAAGDALVEMTGLTEIGRDGRRWAQWLQQSRPGDNADAWRADVLEGRAARLDRLRRRHESLLADVRLRLFKQFQAADTREKRQAVLLEFLSSGEPEVRAIGTDFVTVAMQENEEISQPVRDRLVAMVGDPDRQVRLRTAETLHNMNYAGALGALLTQLAQERDDRVRVALAGAIIPIEDPASVPVLLDVLNGNPSPPVAVAIVRALGGSARSLRATDPGLANAVAARLRAIVRQRGRNAAGGDELRVAALDALAPLKDPFLLDPVLGPALLIRDPSPAVRQAALRALGEFVDNEGAAQMALDVLAAAQRDPVTRRLALDALGRAGGMVYYQKFFDSMQPRNEPDPEVREAAWQALKAALPRGSDQQLSNTAQLLKTDPDRHVFVAQVLAERMRQRNKLDEWAMQVQNIAEDELRLKTPRRAEAAAHFEEALNYWTQNNGAALTIDELTRKVLEARLAATQYTLAATFAQSAILKRGALAQEVVGPIIKNEADRLRTDRDFRNALALIDAALKMDPQLDPRHHRDLQQIRSDIERTMSDGKGPPATTAPTTSPTTAPSLAPAPAPAGGVPPVQ